MNFLNFKSALMGTILLTIATACIDDDYDLSDIDTTSQIKVDNLEIPINLDVINLSNIIEIDGNSQVQVYTDAQGNKFYAVKESGTFESSAIYIDQVSCDAPVIAPNVTTINGSTISIPGYTIPIQPNVPITPPAGINISYDIPTSINEFSYDIHNIDPAIHAIKSIAIQPMNIDLTLSLSELSDAASLIEFKNLKILAPKGLVAEIANNKGTYNSSTGEIHVEQLEATNGVADVTLVISGIDFEAFDTTLDYEKHSLNYSGEIDIMSGEIHAITSGHTLPSEFHLTVSIELDDIVATAFTGDIEYTISGVDIPDVDISDIPDFFAGSSTDISLLNPQIYLNLNNPVGNYGLECQTGLTLTAKRNGQPSQDYTINDPYFTIGANAGNAFYSFCLSPENPTDPIPGYSENYTWVGFSSLSHVLSGDGFPQSIGITLNNPCIPTQTVTNFQLGTNIDGVTGKYELFAPLALKDGSTIVYTTTEDGWGDEDLDKMVIEKLEVTAYVTTNIPLGAKLSATVLDRNGNKIDATLTSTDIPGFAQNEPLTITLEDGQKIKNLDGITFTAIVIADGETPLSPETVITLSNIRAKVSGNYTTEL